MLYVTAVAMGGEDETLSLLRTGAGARAELQNIEETLVRASYIMEEGNSRFLKNEDISDDLARKTSSWCRQKNWEQEDSLYRKLGGKKCSPDSYGSQ